MSKLQTESGEFQSLPEMVYQRLRNGVLKGEFPPGHSLKQEELAQRFGASRVPLREAMTRLETEGLLELRPRCGYSVISLKPEEIQEIFALRAIIEEHAGKAAARARTDGDIKDVKKILTKMEKINISGSDEKTNQWLELNSAFHDRVFASGKLRHVSRVTFVLRDLVEPYIRIEMGLTKDVAEAELEHRQIFDALVEGDPEKLGYLCRAHCEHTADRLIRAL